MNPYFDDIGLTPVATCLGRFTAVSMVLQLPLEDDEDAGDEEDMDATLKVRSSMGG